MNLDTSKNKILENNKSSKVKRRMKKSLLVPTLIKSAVHLILLIKKITIMKMNLNLKARKEKMKWKILQNNILRLTTLLNAQKLVK